MCTYDMTRKQTDRQTDRHPAKHCQRCLLNRAVITAQSCHVAVTLSLTVTHIHTHTHNTVTTYHGAAVLTPTVWTHLKSPLYCHLYGMLALKF